MGQNIESLRIRAYFEKVAREEVRPTNFGICLQSAVADGMASKEQVARILGSKQIRKAGNALKPHEVAGIARAVLALHG